MEFIKIRNFNKINSDWQKILKNANKRRAKIKRVHVFKKPLSEYIKFEIESYKLNIKEGEEIYTIDKIDFDDLKLKIDFDFWLFDDNIVLKMYYDKGGKFLGFEEIPTNLNNFINIKNILLSKSKPL